MHGIINCTAAVVEFDYTGNGHGERHGGYDPSFTALFGAMINKPARFNSSGQFRAFGPWEQARGASFFPSVFDARSAPSLRTAGSTIALDHFVAYVKAATEELLAGPF
jgi:hypothetical protein